MSELGELIGTATTEKDGLMPKESTVYNSDTADPLDFNELTGLFRLFCSYGGTNAPIGGSYYWGIINVGWNKDHFIQIACATLDTEFVGIYVRPHSGNSGFHRWRQIVPA